MPSSVTFQQIMNAAILAVCVLAGCAISAPAGAAEQRIEHSRTQEAVKITLGFSADEIYVGDPLVLIITMENEGPVKVELSSKFFLSEGNDVNIRVQPPGELVARYDGALDVANYSATPTDLYPQMPVTRDIKMLYDRTQKNGYLFGQPGTYGVSAAFSYQLGGRPNPLTISMPAIQVTVKPREGREAEAFEKVKDPLSAKCLHLGIIPDPETTARLRKVGEEYADTLVGGACLKTVGLHLAFGRAPDRNEAVKLLLRYLKANIKALDADQIAYTILACHHLEKRYDLARDWAFYVAGQYPDSAFFHARDPLYLYYYFAPQEYANAFPWYLLEKPWTIPGAEIPTKLTPPID